MVTSFAPNPRSTIGGAVVMDGQLRTLSRRHETTLATLSGADDYDERALAAWRREGVEVHTAGRSVLGGPSGLSRRARLAARWLRGRDPMRAVAFRLPALQRVLDGLAQTRRFDVIQVEDVVMGNYRYPAGIPTVLTEHEVRDPWRRERGFGRMNRLAGAGEAGRWPRFQVRVWRRFHRLQVFTHADADGIARLAPDLAGHVRVNPFGVDLPAGASDPRPGEGVLFVGGFRHPPNVDAAVWLVREILPPLRALAPGVRITIVGADPPSAVRSLAASDVTVTGTVPDVAPYLADAGVVVAPLRQGGGMRLKVLEAMAAARPVVATPLAAEGLALDGWARREPAPLLLASNAGGMARAIAELLSAPERRIEQGRTARRFVAEHHSWDAYGRRLDAIYEEIRYSGTQIFNR